MKTIRKTRKTQRTGARDRTSASKKSRTRAPAVFPVVLIVLGVLLVIVWWAHKITYNRALSLSDSLVSAFATESTEMPVPVSINIPGIPRLLVVEAGKINGTWSVSEKAANHVRGSANPGSPGNIIIYAHNTAPLFGRLKRVKPDDTITVTTTDADRHTYRVIEIRTVTTDQTALLQQTSQEMLTLYTCTGWLDSKRLVIRAVPINR